MSSGQYTLHWNVAEINPSTILKKVGKARFRRESQIKFKFIYQAVFYFLDQNMETQKLFGKLLKQKYFSPFWKCKQNEILPFVTINRF